MWIRYNSTAKYYEYSNDETNWFALDLSGQTAALSASITTLNGQVSTLQSQLAALGLWTNISFSSSNFSVTAGTWTVVSGNIASHRYSVINKKLSYAIYLINTVYTGGGGILGIKLPSGMLSAGALFFPYIYYTTTDPWSIGLCNIAAGSDTLFFYTAHLNNFPASNPLQIALSVEIPLA